MSEYVLIGEAFLGVGLMFVFLVIAYLFYQISRLYKQIIDKEEAYTLSETIAVTNVAKEKGIDIDAYKLMQNNSFRKKLEKEAIKKYFDEKQ